MFNILIITSKLWTYQFKYVLSLNEIVIGYSMNPSYNSVSGNAYAITKKNKRSNSF